MTGSSPGRRWCLDGGVDFGEFRGRKSRWFALLIVAQRDASYRVLCFIKNINSVFVNS
jgi:hypothetical protein